MDKEYIIQIVSKYVDQAISGQQIENAKVDLKREWYDLKELKGLNEFIKDTSSIANTPGPEGFIIIGVDENSCTQKDAFFKDSKLKDSNELIGVINKRVDRAFDINYLEVKINGKNVGIIHIPPSIDKPHVIKNYQRINKKGELKEEQQKVFIRSDTSTRAATKFDLERMIFDRKNIQPDYMFEIFVNQIGFGMKTHKGVNKTAALGMIGIENSGKRPASISALNLHIHFEFDTFIFGDAEAEFDINGRTSRISIDNRNLIVKSNDIIQKGMNLYTRPGVHWDSLNSAKKAGGVKNIEAEIVLNNGKKIMKQCTILFDKKKLR